jgi:glycosyltransferase involved in cell wall biosynthesis
VSGSTVLLYGSRRPLDQFAGVPEKLRELGAEVLYERLWDREMRAGLHAQPELIGRADVVGFADLSYNMHLRPVRVARRLGVATVLLVDGVTEFAITYMNPWMGPNYLRPAPEDRVLALGPLQRRVLGAMGNDVVACGGLPRLDGFAGRVAAAREGLRGGGWLVVATAWTPALSGAARARLLSALAALRDEAERRGLAVRWRLTGGLAESLGVEADTAPLAESLAGAAAVVTTASTLAVESMLAGVPTGVMHPHPWPLWVPGAWVWRPRGGDASDAERVRAALQASAGVRAAVDTALVDALGGFDPELPDAGSLVESLLSPESARLAVQGRLLGHMHTPGSAGVVAAALLDAAARGTRAGPGAIEHIGRTEVVATPKRKKRVLSLLQCGRSPVHGVTNWSVRMSRAFAGRSDYEFHTLFVAAAPTNFEEANTPDVSGSAFLHRCVLEPTAGTHERLEALYRAAASLEPDIVIPGHDEEVLATAARLAEPLTGARTIGIAHVDEPTEFARLEDFGVWDAVVGVSAACVAGLARVGSGLPARQIVYGVPVSERPRPARADGPLRIGYLGRVVEWQKRVSDLIRLLGALRERGVDYEFHLVGDGPDLDAWMVEAQAAGVAGTRLVVHGRQSMSWTESFLPTLDVSVLVSGWEGTSVAMLEAMGQGVVPCVTRVGSGVDEWVTDGVHGVVTPVGRPEIMAARLAELAADRGALERMGAAAHGRLTERRMGLSDGAARYAELFDAVLASRRAVAAPRDRTVRLRDRCEWSPAMPDDDGSADAWVLDRMREAGYRRIARARPTPGCDAVFVPAAAPRPDPSKVAAWRAGGLGVGVSPNMGVEGCVRIAEAAVGRLAGAGCRRIAVFGAGTQAAAFGPLVRRDGCGGREGAVVGWIDDSTPPGTTHMGLPACRFDEAMERLRPDGVVLNSRRFEPLLAERCAAWSDVRTVAMTRDDAALHACVAALRAARDASASGTPVLAVCERDTLAYAAAVGARETVAPAALAGRVERGGRPGLVVLAMEADEAVVRGVLAPWTESGVAVRSLLRAERPVHHGEQVAGETVEAEAFAAAGGDSG